MQPLHYINSPLGGRSKGPRRDQCQKSFKIGQGERKRERDESESSEEHDMHDFDSATTDARESVESAEDGGKPSS
jgi:hypothetical protein